MRNLLITLLICITLNSFSQDGRFNMSDVGKDFRGYVVLANHDTIKGSINLKHMYSMQKAPLFSPDSKDFKYVNRRYVPDGVICYELLNDTKWYSSKFVKLNAPKDFMRLERETFLLVYINGPISVFEYNFYEYDPADPSKNQAAEYIQFPNGKAVTAPNLLFGFKNKMSDYVKDYPELATKIRNKEKGYEVTNVYDIIKEYNAWYLARNPGFTIMKK